MSDRFDALALPPRDPYPALPFGHGYGLPMGPPPPEGPPVLWRLTRRFWKPLLVCALISLPLAYAAGKFLTKPLWQADATLLYQPIALSEKQKAAYEHPPSLPTLAGWVKESALLRQVIDEFHLGVGPDDLADRFIKVEQPASTESIVVSFKWPDADVAKAALTRLLDLYADYVVTTRKEAVLLRVEKIDQQLAYGCEDEIKRLDEQLAALQKKLDENKKLGDEDLDASMLARRSSLQGDIRKLGYDLSEMKSDLTFQRGLRGTLEPLVRQNAEPRAKLEALDQTIEQLELKIEHARGSIDANNEELRTLPIVVTKTKRKEQSDKLKWLKDQLKQHAAARALLSQPGGPPGRGALEGMDAKEMSVKSPPRVGDKPASSSRKVLFGATFLGLMSVAFGLFFVYDRRHPAPEDPTLRPPVVHVTPPPGSTLNGADVHRLAASLHAWVRDNKGPIVTPPPESPITINPNGDFENGSSATNGGADPELLAARVRQWLGEGLGPK